LAEELAEVRVEIARLARRKDVRFVPRSPKLPCDWKPTTVMNPDVGIPFTDISAWHYIAHLAESGHHIEEIELDQPKGEKGYVMIVELRDNPSDLYIKVQLKGGRIYGRSFHCSYYK
jgi:hypothetical protein